MTPLLRRCAGLFLLLAPIAYAAPVPKLRAPLAEADKAHSVVLYIEQSEVAVDDANVGNAGGGLLGVLIESAMESTMTRNRQEAIVPVRDTLLEFRFEDEFSAALKQHLPTSMVAQDAGFVVVRSDQEYRDHLRAVTPATVLLVKARYAFEQNFEMAYVHALAQLQKAEQTLPDEAAWEALPNRKKRKLVPIVLHTGSYYSAHVTHSPYAKQTREKGDAKFEHNAKRWAEHGADKVRAAFSQAVEEVALTIQREAHGELPAAGAKKRALIPSVTIYPFLRKMPTLETREGRTLLQDKFDLHWVDDRLIRS